MKVKVLSWNIWIDGKFDEIKRFLEESDADIVGLQEVKDDDPERDVIGFLMGLGYEHIFAPIIHERDDGSKHRYGPAVFSRHRIESSEIVRLSESVDRTAALADINVGGGALRVVSTHIIHTHFKPSDEPVNQVKRLLEFVNNERTIVMGDFNDKPESEVLKVAADKLVDTDPNLTPTWSNYPEGCGRCNPQKIDTRLDYIFVTPDIRFSSFEVGNSSASDHLPVSVVIEI